MHIIPAPNYGAALSAANSCVRHASLEDMPRLLEMGQAFLSESGMGAFIEFDEESTAQTFIELIKAGGLFVAQSGRQLFGMAGALAYPVYFNVRHKTAQELFWWIDPSKRGSMAGMRLLQALESWAKAQGCNTISMISLPGLDGSPAAKLYEKTGYRPSENLFIKVL